MVRRSVEDVSLSIPFDDRFTDPQFAEGVLEEVWDMVKRVRSKGKRREERYEVHYPMRGTLVSITVRREQP